MIAAGCLLALGACKPAERIVPMPTPTPAPAVKASVPTSPGAVTNRQVESRPSAPVIAPTRKNVAPSNGRFDPERTYYVVKYFSVVSEAGIVGFTPGKPVRLIEQKGDNFVVTDGITQATAPRSSFAKDPAGKSGPPERAGTPNVADWAPKTDAEDQAARLEKTKSQLAKNAAHRAEEAKKALEAQRLARIKAEVKDLTKRIAAAEKEISEKRSTQRPVRKTYDAWGTLISYQGRSTFTLSPDASGIDRLIAKRDKLMAELGEPTEAE